MRHALTERFQNVPLSQKILLILIATILASSPLLYAGYLVIIHANNGQLYQTSSRMLSFASEDISKNLSAVEEMGDSILEDENIQDALSQCMDTSENAVLQNAHSLLYTSVNSYFQRYKANHVNYIQIVNKEFTAMASSSTSRVIPSEIQRELILQAEEADGHLLWVTDFSRSYGVFLVREIKKTKNLSLEPLGTLIVNIDMAGLHKNISYANSVFPVCYALYSGEKNLYLSDSLTGLNREDLPSISDNSYAFSDVNGLRYLVIKGRINATEWDYYCLASYDGLYRNTRVIQSLFFVIIVISVLISILMMKLMMKPLTEDFHILTQKIQSFGNGNLKLPDAVPSYSDRQDEIGLIHQQFDSMAARIRTLIHKNYESKIQAKEAQLKALEMQINPHFLYNTLQTINWRAKMLHDAQISTMTESLGKFLRITLSKNNEDSSLRQELELVLYYINIQKLRFDGELSCEINVSDDCLDAYLPKFTLQPLIENAVRYGLEYGDDICSILIDAAVENGQLTVLTANTGSSFEEDFLRKLNTGKIRPHGFGIGILNVCSRLKLIYGDSYSINFFNRNNYACVSITIPFCTKKPENMLSESNPE